MGYIKREVVGKTLEQVLLQDIYVNHIVWLRCASVFAVKDDEDEIGKKVAESHSLLDILRKHPELRGAVIAHYNDFFGEDVFRVRLEGCHE